MKNKLKNNLKTIGIIIILIVFTFIFKEWLRVKMITALGGFSNREIVKDTTIVYKKGKIDTLAIFTEYITNHNININPKPIIEYRYKYNDPVVDEVVVLDSVKKFTVDITDDIIEGTAIVTNSYKGDMLDMKLRYLPLIPKLIQRTDTIERLVTETVTLTNERAYFGIGMGFNNLQVLSLSGSYTSKQKWQVIGTYGKSLQQTKALINGVPFSFTPNDYIGLTIIKNW